jgi:hypothetical protein
MKTGGGIGICLVPRIARPAVAPTRLQSEPSPEAGLPGALLAGATLNPN